MNDRVPIEVKPGSPLPAGTDLAWLEAMGAVRAAGRVSAVRLPGHTDKAFLREEHHNSYGRPWALGKYLFAYARSRGLRPDHRVLDCGCGSGRLAVRLVPYLDAGMYCGIDIHLQGLLALATYEVPLHDLAPKRPRLLLNGDFAFDYFGDPFDWVFDCFVSFHLSDPAQQRAYFTNAARVLRPGGRLACLPEPKLPAADLRDLGLELEHREVQPCPLLAGHDYIAENHWFEYVRRGP
jgi:SAM-dependent methyltransferase